MRRTTRTRTGSSFGFALATLILLTVPSWIQAEKKSAAPYALIAGTTFRPPGLSLSGAAVRIEPKAPVSGGVRLKRVEAVTDSRGEFAVRVPPVPAEWTLNVQAKGYQAQTRTVSISGEERLDLSFVLEPEQAQAKKGEGK